METYEDGKIPKRSYKPSRDPISVRDWIWIILQFPILLAFAIIFWLFDIDFRRLDEEVD